MQNHPLLGRRVAWIGAHPDDESFTVGGTLAAIVASGGTVNLLVATRGERGRAHIDQNLTDAALMDMRRSELFQAASIIGVTEISLLDLPDGSLGDHLDELQSAIEAHVITWHSDVIISFGADGYTGHADHAAAGKAAHLVALQRGIPFFAVSLPEQDRAEFSTRLAGKRLYGTYNDAVHSGELFHQAVDAAVKMKLLRCYHSQFDGLDPYTIFPRELADHFLANEYFVVTP